MTAAQQQGLTGEDFAALAAKAKLAGPAYARNLKKVIRDGGQGAVRAAQTSGSRFSSRFAGAVGMQVRTAGQRAGALVTVSRKKAPHGRPIENDNKAGVFFHPVFGRSRTEVTAVAQDAHPWFFSAVAPVAERTAQDITTLVDEFAREAGFS